MKVVNLCISHISNLPYLWGRALREHAGVESIMIYGGEKTWSGWDIDLWVQRDRPETAEKALQHIREADAVIFHGHAHDHFAFGKTRLARVLRDKPVFHTLAVSPYLIWKNTPFITWRRALQSDRPLMVVDPGMLSAFPHAHLVPLFVPADDALYQPSKPESAEGRPLRFLLATTNAEMKRVPAMLAGIERLRELSRREIQLDYITKVDHDELMRRKRKADIIFDMLLGTGGWGMNGCESASLGRPTVAYFDPAASAHFATTLGCESIETINVPPDPEVIARTLLPLVEDDALRLEKGRRARKWVEQYWSDRVRGPFIANLLLRLLDRPHLRLAV